MHVRHNFSNSFYPMLNNFIFDLLSSNFLNVNRFVQRTLARYGALILAKCLNLLSNF